MSATTRYLREVKDKARTAGLGLTVRRKHHFREAFLAAEGRSFRLPIPEKADSESQAHFDRQLRRAIAALTGES